MFFNRNRAGETKHRIKKAVDNERMRCLKEFQAEKLFMKETYEDNLAYEIAERDAVIESLSREISRLNKTITDNGRKIEKAHLWARTNARHTAEIWAASKDFMELAVNRYKHIGELRHEVEIHLISVEDSSHA